MQRPTHRTRGPRYLGTFDQDGWPLAEIASDQPWINVTRYQDGIAWTGHRSRVGSIRRNQTDGGIVCQWDGITRRWDPR